MAPGSATLSPPQTTSRIASLADFFFFCANAGFFLLFPTMRSLVPGYYTDKAHYQIIVLSILKHKRKWSVLDLISNCI